MTRKADLARKAKTAKALAASHYNAEPRLVRIIHFSNAQQVEALPSEPIKLLEVNPATVPVKRLVPMHFKSSTSIPFPVDLIEVTPDQYDQIQAKILALPPGWQVGKEIPKP